MGRVEAATRIIEIHDVLVAEALGVPKRSEPMVEQGSLWDEHFFGAPYEAIAALAPHVVAPEGSGSV